jgi:acyl-coenzyme A synthetase/AMP-(fatty) acid ligase
VKILVERDGDAAQALEEAWEDPETFAYLPVKSGGHGAGTPWISADLPLRFRTGHFALFSSGSTGEPRLVFGSRERAERLARLLHQVQSSDPVRHTIGLLPLSYSYAFVNQWLWARTLGREYTPTQGFAQPEILRDALTAADAAMVCLVAAHVPLLERHFGACSFPGVIRVHFAGGRFPQENLGEVRRYFPEAAIFNNYGCIEAMPRLSLRRAEDGDSASDVGEPLAGVELSSSPEGKLFFRSTHAAVAFCDEAGFHEIDSEDWIFTGDYGRRAPTGHWHLEGRASEVFKRYGAKISLPVLLGSVNAAWRGQAAFYREMDSLGESGHVLVLAPPPSDRELRAILGRLRREHERAHWPLRVESAEVLPLLRNGKIDGRALSGLPGKRVEWSQHI